MEIKNLYESKLEDFEKCHDGVGILKHITLFEDSDFKVNIRFINFTVLPPDTSIGEHKHGNDEEVYIILEGRGLVTLDGESREVKRGDVIVNKPFGTHSLLNNSREDLQVLVFEVYL